ncbi:MAG: hypothetical protein JNM40_13405 [Myxococcales bacterium]|nr:hypothetical protein [Myxococcales bacterium]
MSESPRFPMMIGRHKLTVEDDIVVLTQIGDHVQAEVLQVTVVMAEVLAAHGRLFFLLDLTQAEKTAPEARRHIAEWSKRNRISGIALFGGSVAARAVSSLAIAAIRLFRGDHTPTVFTATESEARAWIAEQRRRLAKSSTL